MSHSKEVYCKELSVDLVPKMVKRLNDYDMIVEIHPEFSFDQQNDSGFLPFKFRFKDTSLIKLKDKDFKTGFEIYISDFDLQKAKSDLQPKLSFLDKLLGKKHTESAFAAPEIEKRLIHCKKQVSFVWHSDDPFEFRFASMTSAVLTELTNGVCFFPADNIWYDNSYIAEQAFRETLTFENSLDERELKCFEFDGW